LLIESTYIDTLDCINLDGVRTTSDTIAGYRMTGQYRPEWWLIARQGDVDVGCLIMADHEVNDQCELVYMGIVPQARGHGLGRQLVKHALWLAASRERERLVLAVDRRNWPARDIYTQCGFQTWATRSIMIKRYDS
jgi:ribosomal protein S18 acetylase RimI-like enzyme